MTGILDSVDSNWKEICPCFPKTTAPEVLTCTLSLTVMGAVTLLWKMFCECTRQERTVLRGFKKGFRDYFRAVGS